MKNRYDVLKEIELTKLVGLNIIPIHLMDWLVIYEYYISERKTLGKMQSYSNTAENYKLSESHIMNVVAWMQGR